MDLVEGQSTIILVEVDGSPDILQEVSAPPGKLILNEPSIEVLPARPATLEKIVVAQVEELLVGAPPVPVPQGDACFSCLNVSYQLPSGDTLNLANIPTDLSYNNSVILSVDLIDSTNDLYLSMLIHGVRTNTDVDYTISRVGDALPSSVVLTRSSTGVLVTATNTHSENLTVILRRI